MHACMRAHTHAQMLSISLDIRGTQIKSIIRYPNTLIQIAEIKRLTIASVGRNGRVAILYLAGVSVKSQNYFEEQAYSFLN